eukprot:9187834-Alexandrium_andersonii.AAC.1
MSLDAPRSSSMAGRAAQTSSCRRRSCPRRCAARFTLWRKGSYGRPSAPGALLPEARTRPATFSHVGVPRAGLATWRR